MTSATSMTLERLAPAPGSVRQGWRNRVSSRLLQQIDGASGYGVTLEAKIRLAYIEGRKNGILPHTMDSSENPYWGVRGRDAKALSLAWVEGWNDGAELFCARRDNPRNDRTEAHR